MPKRLFDTCLQIFKRWWLGMWTWTAAKEAFGPLRETLFDELEAILGPERSASSSANCYGAVLIGVPPNCTAGTATKLPTRRAGKPSRKHSELASLP